MQVCFTRVLRTASSERYLLHIDGQGDDAALDLHYVDGGRVVGTLIVLDKKYAAKDVVAEILEQVDRFLLPDADLNDGNIEFTVVKGTVIGGFSASAHAS